MTNSRVFDPIFGTTVHTTRRRQVPTHPRARPSLSHHLIGRKAPVGCNGYPHLELLVQDALPCLPTCFSPSSKLEERHQHLHSYVCLFTSLSLQNASANAQTRQHWLRAFANNTSRQLFDATNKTQVGLGARAGGSSDWLCTCGVHYL